MTARSPGALRFGAPTLLSLGAFLVPGTGFLLVAWIYRNFTVDDPFITFRYARNLVMGLGLVYNPGQAVEGFSSPIWVAVSSLWIKIAGTDPEIVAAGAKALGTLFGLLALAGCWRLAGLLNPHSARLAGFAASLTLALTIYFPLWAVSGSETPLFCAGVVWLVVFLSEEATSARVPWRSAAVGAALPWIRPEGVLLAVVAAAAATLLVLPRSGGLWKVAPGLLPIAALAALFASRWLIFDELLPNTYYAKSSHGLNQMLLDGGDYLRRWLSGPGTALLAGALLGMFMRRRDGAARYPILLASGFAAIVILGTWWVGGDWMPGFRFLMPAYALLAALAGAGLTHPVAPLRYKIAALAAGSLMIASPWIAWVYLVHQAPLAGPNRPESLVPEDRFILGRWIESHVPPESLIAIGEAGIIPYITGHAYVDVFGLTDKTIARMPGKWAYKTPTDYLLDRDPDYMILYGDHFRDLAGPTVGRFEFEYANALIADERFQSRYDEIHRHARFAVFCRRGEGREPSSCRKLPQPRSI